ncbi:MAG: sugar transferase [Flavobacterium sp.]|uniref:sugar transferase n=1 Tax=Flavobacterium sp. TaxID=239 RepID=UPI00121E16C9|nr:sugar transferase [Flavobacterium sp.]RZJ66061.1 MAG: sugar transferase [Flavobacterium sp.]
MYAVLKRPLQLFLVLISAPVWLIVYAIVALLVAVKIGRPVLFSQDRCGLDGRVFRIYKFRTMTNERDENGVLLPDNLRLTAFGKFLRSSSLDELPSLFNVIKGDMSLVGPRPLLAQYLELYSPFQKRRHEVLPGITGWAQVNGRNAISWEQKFEYDVWYVDHESFLLDCRIILLTLKKVVVAEGINAANDSAMEVFRGSKQETP